MSALAIARSSLITSLLRYRRSWGLWLLLLVAPVGARFMISDEDGKGIAIAIGDHLPVLTSAVLGVWLGVVVTTLLLPIGYIYLRSNTNRRQPWQIEEVTSALRMAIMLGRFSADVAVLFAMLAALTVAGWFLGWLMVSGPLNLWAITSALWVVAAPALMGLAAIRIFFDAVPWLRRGLGDFAYFVLWMTSIVMPVAVQDEASSLAVNMYDFPGFIRPLVGGAPAKDRDFGIGGITVKPGRVPLNVAAGLDAKGYMASRALWAAIAVALAALSGLIYYPHTPPKRMKAQGWLARLLAAGPPPIANADAPPARAIAAPWLGLIVAEGRLIGSGKLFMLLAVGAAVAGMFGDYRHIGSPAALLLLVFALSAHAGRSEARGLLSLTATAALSPWARRAAFIIAGLAWSLAMAVPAALVGVSAMPLMLAGATGLIGVSVAIGLAFVSSSGFAPRIVLLILWYGYFSS
jgi:hypothetical protein